MLLWLLFSVLTAATLALILRPLMLPSATAPGAAQGDGALAVYRDQLAEIDAEARRGLMAPAEAEAARIEISRRLLAAADASAPAAAASPLSDLGRRLGLGIAGLTPLMALGLYLAFGSPGLPGQPHAERMQEALARDKLHMGQVSDLVAKVEARLKEAPDDGRGWEVIAPVYFKLGRYRDAANAFQRAVVLLGESPQRLAGLAEASVFAADGIVTEEARKAYERVLVLEPKRIEARFWLALAKEQDGDLKGAKADFEALVAAAPAEAPWRGAVEERVRALGLRLEGKGPSAEDIAASAGLDPAQRRQMIEGMVEGLAQRLKTDGRDLAGWVRLVRAYSVLERAGEARAALDEARKALAGDEAAQRMLTQLATSLGLGS
ncbi:MAG: c-type cytochrome biogenesis protein CcmI [Hyphomicrobiaceae bacterium]|nr:c-type cytochrome biogenesis protein CcmI [Hyphomicrobiaceae bacterium]